MRKKPFHLCSVFACPHPTASGLPERNPLLRTCVHHGPYAPATVSAFSQEAKAAAAQRAPNPRRQPRQAMFPLVCVFKAYEMAVDPATGEQRFVFVTGICGAFAPRRFRGDRSLPRYPTRMGDPLCVVHAHTGADERMYPGEPEQVYEDERLEEGRRRRERMTASDAASCVEQVQQANIIL